ncbi:MAG: patatin family protein [Lachnospiraceae bacterium]|nr:patatin family protein [Lachnospiraceae bacterium]
MKNKVYSKIDSLPCGQADDSITEGCMVLEGGGWRGVYTLGVLDALMENNINLRTTVGISAGALCGIGYVTGQIGWGANIDLRFRHDPGYIGLRAIRKEHSITGFRYLYNDLATQYPVDKKRLKNPEKRFFVGATDLRTGRTHYFEKGKCNLAAAVCASASVPFMSRPVVINGIPYLDGGCSTKIPYDWAKKQGEKKIVVVKTREREYIRKEKTRDNMARTYYHAFPDFVRSYEKVNARFNSMRLEMYEDEKQGKVFIIAPSGKVTVSRFEGDMEKLGELYQLGYSDGYANLEALRNYLSM